MTETLTQLRVINSQWLYDEPAEILRETAHTLTVKHGSTTEKFHRKNGLAFGFDARKKLHCEPNRLLGFNADTGGYEEPDGQVTLFDQLKADQLDTALEETMATIRANNDMKKWFLTYHESNLHVFEKFCELTLVAVEKGFKHYGAMQIIQQIRWETSTSASHDPYKINNNASPFFARMFECVYPERKGFFRTRRSKAD